MCECSKTKCSLIQNENLLIDAIPPELQNLKYAVYPNNEKYNDKRFLYNKLFNIFPQSIYYPTTTCQTKYLLKNLIKNNCSFALRCGGHSYEPASLSNNYIIDVSKFNNIKIHKKYAIVGSGIKLGDLINVLKINKKITATGESSCVGISGLVLCGGKGYMSRFLGMACDNIIEIKILNYKNKILIANENENSDLFWALRGAGICNFGIVLEYKVKLHNDVYMQMTTIKWEWDSNTFVDIMEKYFIWIVNLPNNISSDINIIYENGTAYIYVKFTKYTKKKEKNNFPEISIFESIKNPTITKCYGWYSQSTDCWVSYDTGYANCFSKLKSTMVFETITNFDIFINSIEKLLLDKYNLKFQFNFTQLSGKVLESNCAYFPKNALMSLTMPILWSNTDLTNYCLDFMNNIYESIIEITSNYVFPNMVDYDLLDYMNSYYGDNSQKLIEIKNKYDPNNIFKWKQSIPLV